jgi:multiple sugar transport system substrate-binding protein
LYDQFLHLPYYLKGETVRQNKKLAILASTAMVAALAVAGCSSGSSGGSSGTKTLSLWVPAGTPTIAPYVASFNKSHPGIKVTVREIPFATYDTALGQAFSAGQGPDLAQINGTSMPSFAGKGFLQPITPIIGTSGDVAKSNFYPNLYSAAAFQGQQVSIPIDTGTRVLQYNKKLFAKAGIADFGATATYPEILAAAQKIRALGSKYQGFCYVGGVKEYTINSNLGPFVIQSGGSFVNSSDTKATLDSPAAIAGVTFFKNLALTSDKSDIVAQSSAACVEGMSDGTVGMQFDGFWDIPPASSNFQLGQTLPVAKTVYSTTGGWVLGVPKYVKSAEYATLKTFVTDMYKPANLVNFTGLMPATKSGRGAATTLKAPQYQIYWKILNENANNPIPLTDNLVAQENLLTSALQSILQGSESVPVALSKANAALQATLTK